MKNILISLIIVNVLMFSIGVSTSLATTWHVPGDAPTIQAGINMASGGDTVLVACGTYFEHNINMKSGVQLLSETGQPDCVTINAQQQGRVIYCRFTGSTTRVEGFTITGGHAPNNPYDGNGGGIYCIDLSSPWIVNCVIEDNYAEWNGGGVCCYFSSSPTFIDCIVTNNQADNGGSGMQLSNNSSPTLINCTVSDNMGSGIWTSNSSSPELINCTISGNAVSGIEHTCPPFGIPADITLTDCIISSNTGGGMRFWNVTGNLNNCSFTGNSTGSNGGGMSLNSASVALVNCNFSGNSAYTGGGIYLENASYLAADTTKFENNTASSAGAHGYINSGNEAVLTCCVTDLTGFAGDGTITLNNEGCNTATERSSWGGIKALKRKKQ
jgi:parallel beta-helix repeat protein